MWIKYNPNPVGRHVGDCSVRAVAKALGTDWETAYMTISDNAYRMGDMPSSDSVWGAVLRQNGFYRASIPNRCPDCYTAEEFAAITRRVHMYLALVDTWQRYRMEIYMIHGTHPTRSRYTIGIERREQHDL